MRKEQWINSNSKPLPLNESVTFKPNEQIWPAIFQTAGLIFDQEKVFDSAVQENTEYIFCQISSEGDRWPENAR